MANVKRDDKRILEHQLRVEKREHRRDYGRHQRGIRSLIQCRRRLSQVATTALVKRTTLDDALIQYMQDGKQGPLIQAIQAVMEQLQLQHDRLSTWEPDGGWPTREE